MAASIVDLCTESGRW